MQLVHSDRGHDPAHTSSRAGLIPLSSTQRSSDQRGAAAVRPRFGTTRRQPALSEGCRSGKLTRPNPSGDLEGTKGDKNGLMDCIRRIASVKNVCCSGQRKMEVTGRGQSSAVDL